MKNVCIQLLPPRRPTTHALGLLQAATTLSAVLTALLVWERRPSTALPSVREADASAKVMVRHRPIRLRPPQSRESPAEGEFVMAIER